MSTASVPSRSSIPCSLLPPSTPAPVGRLRVQIKNDRPLEIISHFQWPMIISRAISQNHSDIIPKASRKHPEETAYAERPDFVTSQSLLVHQFAKQREHLHDGVLATDGYLQVGFTRLLVGLHDAIDQLLSGLSRLECFGQSTKEGDTLTDQLLGMGRSMVAGRPLLRTVLCLRWRLSLRRNVVRRRLLVCNSPMVC